MKVTLEPTDISVISKIVFHKELETREDMEKLKSQIFRYINSKKTLVEKQHIYTYELDKKDDENLYNRIKSDLYILNRMIDRLIVILGDRIHES